MKKRALHKDFVMEIRKSMGRFVSIFFIVALGVAFYSGIRASEPSMRISGDAYFDRGQLMDIKVMGTLGMTDDDIQAISKLDGIEIVEGAYSKDVLCPVGDTEKVVHLLSLQEHFNQIEVVEGRLPEKAGECLVDEDFISGKDFKIGDQITFRSGDEEELTDSLTTDTFEIVGIGNSPLYISFGRGSSLIGNGEVSGFVVTAAESFQMDVYTELYVRVAGLEETIAYTDEYEELSDAAVEAIEAIEEERCLARRQEIVDEAMEEVYEAEAEIDEEAQKLEDAKIELSEGKVTADNELAKALKKLKDAEVELANAKQQIAEGEQQIEEGKTELQKQQKTLSQGEKEYQAGVTTLEEKENELKAGEAEYQKAYEENMPLITAGKEQLTAGIAQLEEGLAPLNEMKAALEIADLETKEYLLMQLQQSGIASEEELEAQIIGLEEQKSTLEAQLEELVIQEEALIQAGAQIEEGKKQIEAAKEELKAAKQQIDSGKAQIEKAWKVLLSKEKELKAGKAELSSGEQELAEGYQQYEEAAVEAAEEIADGEAQIAEGEEKLADARREIAEAKAEIEEIEHPEWYVQDRGDAMSDYDGYGENSDRMGSLGKVFPVLFFMVAALISLTTMTRMVEEQRTQIGTLKALGYGKFDIAKKYIYYALIATVCGSIFGFLVGEKIIPFVIIFAYKIMYKHLPDILLPYHIGYGLQAMLISVCCTLAATIFSCFKELAAQPAQLMRPPAPKKGKRVFLERIGWIWRRLSFTWKSSIRNMIRYKKRFFMTVLGIGGCMALMVVGFGLKDCIYEIVTLQYKEIQFQDASVYLDSKANEEAKQEIMAYLEGQAAVAEYEQLQMQRMDVTSENGKESVYIVVPEDETSIENLYCFRSRTSDEVYHLTEEEVILTEKVATLLEVEVGDTITIHDEEKGKRDLVVEAICENYMGYYLYISNDVYEEAYDAPAKYNSILYTVEEGKEDSIEAIGEALLKMDHVLNVSYTNSMESRLDDMLGSLNLVIIVLIVSAGMLAFVVLYNLNNINITERRRELATLKVLGFYDGEVASYVFRENIMLTFISSIVGVLLGNYLHRFVILTVEVENVMFGREIHLESYLFSFLLTLVFSLFINGMMYFKLKKIDMVESLKSVE